MMLNMNDCASSNRTLLMLALVMLVACVPSMVAGGAVFEEVKPILPLPSDYKLVFEAPTAAEPGEEKPAAVVVAASTPFNETTIQINLATLEPCGVIGVHIHPRGTEHVVVIKGKVEFGMFFEDGSSTQLVTASAGEGVVIPQGTAHYARNLGCTKAQFTATFDHPLAGVVFLGEALLSFPEDFRRAQLSGQHVKGPAPNAFFHPKCHCKSHHG